MPRYVMTVILLLAWMSVVLPFIDAAPPRRPYLVDLDDPENVMDLLSRLERSLVRSAEIDHSKRGVDFGLGRGYSGSQAAKHLMGLAAANYAVGPGRKRRDAEGYSAEQQQPADNAADN